MYGIFLSYAIISWKKLRKVKYCLFFCLSFHPYFMSSTKRKRRDQRIASKPFLSGLLDHQMKMGFPTMWSSGTKPQ